MKGRWVGVLVTALGALACGDTTGPSQAPTIELNRDAQLDGSLAFAHLTRSGPEGNITGWALYLVRNHRFRAKSLTGE